MMIPFHIRFRKLPPTLHRVEPQYQVAVEFHVSRKARLKYQFDRSMFTSTGNVIFANFHAARLFAQKMNEKRDVLLHPEQAVSAAELNALGLIDEILHSLLARYRQQVGAHIFDEALRFLSQRLGSGNVDTALQKFVEEFPPLAVFTGETDISAYLKGSTGETPNRQIVLEEMLMLWLSNLNPAFRKYAELFDDSPLRKETPYVEIMNTLDDYFEEQPPVEWLPGSKPEPLLRFLQRPFREAPNSLIDQLKYIKENWGAQLESLLTIKQELILGEAFLAQWGVPAGNLSLRLLRGIDFVTEEQKLRFNPALGPAPTRVPDFEIVEEEPEQFSPDMHWMPRLILIAKSTFVWLDQLSKKYRRSITRLDEIPDEELDLLSRWGFTGLWLIGVWERSQASKKIKQLCGNPEAESSAYSLYDYQIAQQLGGEEAYQNLKERCWQRGIRLASDMVPNHTGIDSKWVMEHPDWFIQLSYPPFPSYTFNGPDLSWNPEISLYIEDHYYDRSDAAVVFKRVDNRTGEVRYIYHGNDGTSMPWNDTAQLDYTQAVVREAVIRTIIEVAKRFPIIRFDAAMTLAKRHFHRLWFPPPGSGGDIPSRAEHGMTRAEFDALMPKEFWREVVDRVTEEVPDTLLLAEAFWLMESYFVRTLGMHRVYNSAFMNMLKNEENEKYRLTIKKTIEFDPEILKRYVNFMNNPDEDTAIEQFGDGDKYFGVCTMLVTMPGLPMFGHGQVEGFREKYGMEYRRAYWDEHPNEYLIARHEREIFPLLKKRALFAEVQHFLLYDFYLADGAVDENVFAYSNRYGNEKALVVFHNVYRETRGWINLSAAFAVKEEGSESIHLEQRKLAEGLVLSTDENTFCIFRDHITGLEYIRSVKRIHEQGLYLELKAYQYHVFMDFREVADDDSRLYARLAESLGDRGVPDMEEAAQEVYLQPLHQAYREAAGATVLQRIIDIREKKSPDSEEAFADILLMIKEKYLFFLQTVLAFEALQANPETLTEHILRRVSVLLWFSPQSVTSREKKIKLIEERLKTVMQDETFTSGVLFNWLLLHRLGELGTAEPENSAAIGALSRSRIEQWMLSGIIQHEFTRLGMDDSQGSHAVSLIKLLITCQNWYENSSRPSTAHQLLERLFRNTDFQQYIGVNEFNNIVWFNKEAFEDAVQWLLVMEVFRIVSDEPEREKKSAAARTGTSISGKPAVLPQKTIKKILSVFRIVEKWLNAVEKSEYQVEKLLEVVKGEKKKKKTTAR